MLGRRRLRVAAVALGLGPAAAFIALLIVARLVPLPDDFLPRSSTVVEFSDGSFAHVFLSPDEKWRIAIDLDEIDPAYIEALIHLEDQRFHTHFGVDPIAIVRAALTNFWRGQVVSGGSTLTMQLVRVREPRPRTLGSKVIEAFRATQLEVRLSKREILGAYVTHVPFGRNLEGVEAGALAYFGHRAKNLSASEIATLLAVPQRPSRRYPCPKNRAHLAAGRDEIAARLVEDGLLLRGAEGARAPAEVLAEVKAAPVPDTLRPFPRSAEHASIALAEQLPHLARIRTTLDRGAQLLAERALQAASDRLEDLGVYNGAVVVADHRTAELKALVGNFRFFDEAHGGQIVGFANPRSPGSVLKPFLYALAIDEGLVLPDFLMLDVPRSFGTYSPRNYDGTFSGLVRAEDALSRSLNVPFVLLLKRLGVERFLGALRMMGAEGLAREVGHYGLSAVVGGVELSPVEVASLYVTLAQDGRHRPLALVARDAPPPSPLPVFSPAAAFLTRKALYLKDRPDFPERRRFTGVSPHIHWKTGTSFGHRDAWAAGSSARHTAVVWLGNFDNAPSAGLVGADAAGPVLFDLLEALDVDRSPVREAPPLDLKPLEVCAYSGRLPGPACRQLRTVLAPKASVPTDRCPYHRSVDVDVATGLALTPECREGHAYRTEEYLAFPPALRRWLSDEHRRVPEPPSLSPDCAPPPSERPPAILSPPRGHVALLIPGVERERQEIPLVAESAAEGGRLSWFMDGEYLGSAASSERLWWAPVPGVHELVVSDETGRSARRRLEVRAYGAPSAAGGEAVSRSLERRSSR